MSRYFHHVDFQTGKERERLKALPDLLGKKRMRCTSPVGEVGYKDWWLERRCQELMQEVKLSSEKQEVLAGLVDDKSRFQRKATGKYNETILEEMREECCKDWEGRER